MIESCLELARALAGIYMRIIRIYSGRAAGCSCTCSTDCIGAGAFFFSPLSLRLIGKLIVRPFFCHQSGRHLYGLTRLRALFTSFGIFLPLPSAACAPPVRAPFAPSPSLLCAHATYYITLRAYQAFVTSCPRGLFPLAPAAGFSRLLPPLAPAPARALPLLPVRSGHTHHTPHIERRTFMDAPDRPLSLADRGTPEQRRQLQTLAAEFESLRLSWNKHREGAGSEFSSENELRRRIHVVGRQLQTLQRELTLNIPEGCTSYFFEPIRCFPHPIQM